MTPNYYWIILAYFQENSSLYFINRKYIQERQHIHSQTCTGCHVGSLFSKIFKQMDKKAHKLRHRVLVLSNWYLTAALETRSLVCLWKSWRVMDIIFWRVPIFLHIFSQKVMYVVLNYFDVGTKLQGQRKKHVNGNDLLTYLNKLTCTDNAYTRR